MWISAPPLRSIATHERCVGAQFRLGDSRFKKLYVPDNKHVVSFFAWHESQEKLFEINGWPHPAEVPSKFTDNPSLLIVPADEGGPPLGIVQSFYEYFGLAVPGKLFEFATWQHAQLCMQ